MGKLEAINQDQLATATDRLLFRSRGRSARWSLDAEEATTVVFRGRPRRTQIGVAVTR
jgi:hypothetical protein